MKKIITTTAAVTLALLAALALPACEDSMRESPLRWRTRVEFPVNRTFSVGEGTRVDGLFDHVDSVAVDFGAETIDVGFDVMDMLRKLEECEAGYSANIINHTDVDLKMHGLIFIGGHQAGTMPVDDFLTLARDIADAGGMNAARNVISLSAHENGTCGIEIDADDSAAHSMTNANNVRSAFCELVYNSQSITWRWIAIVSESDAPVFINDENYLSVKLRLEISGINSFDSLFAL